MPRDDGMRDEVAWKMSTARVERRGGSRTAPALHFKISLQAIEKT